MKLLAPLLSSPPSREGLHGQQQRPGVNLPLGYHGNKRVEEKKEEARQWEATTQKSDEDKTGVCRFFSCLCLNATVLSTLLHNHTPHTHAAAAAV